MPPAEITAIIAALVAVLSAFYARKSAKEAQKANDIGRLNALLAFRQRYIELMAHQVKIAETLKTSQSGLEAVQKAYADLDSKLDEIDHQINSYHSKVVTNKI